MIIQQHPARLAAGQGRNKAPHRAKSRTNERQVELVLALFFVVAVKTIVKIFACISVGAQHAASVPITFKVEARRLQPVGRRYAAAFALFIRDLYFVFLHSELPFPFYFSPHKRNISSYDSVLPNYDPRDRSETAFVGTV